MSLHLKEREEVRHPCKYYGESMLIFSLVSSLDDSSKIKNGSSLLCWCGKAVRKVSVSGEICGGARCGKARGWDVSPTKTLIDSGSLRKKWRKQI